MGTPGRGNDHDIIVAIQNRFGRAGVGGVPAGARMVRGIGDGLRIEPRTQLLADLISSRVLADFVDGDRVPTAMNVEGDFPTLEDCHFFWTEEVPFVRTRVGGTADNGRICRASSSWETTGWWEYAESDFDTRNRRVFMREVAFLSEPDDRDRHDSGHEQML